MTKASLAAHSVWIQEGKSHGRRGLGTGSRSCVESSLKTLVLKRTRNRQSATKTCQVKPHLQKPDVRVDKKKKLAAAAVEKRS